MQTSNDSALFWIGLSSIPGIGRATFRKLSHHFGSPERALAASREELEGIDGLPARVIDGITSFPWREHAERELLAARTSGVDIVTSDSAAYPAGLKGTLDPPLYLYIRGVLPREQSIAVIGTRTPTHYGLTVTHRIAYELATAGLAIVSGLARGIDTQAHRGALAAKGRTIAVLGCGIDVVYPPENKALLEQIAASGAVISENPFGTKPEAGYFPARNRIISGLSRGTVIIEAAEDSGSLITAGYALEQGRKLFAVPGNIGSPTSRGTNSLIKRGALLVEGSGDILRELGINKPGVKQERSSGPLPARTPEEESVFRCIATEPKHIDVIMNETSLAAGRLSGVLITLELKGLAKQLPGKYYVRQPD
jgi:DNA processing protein